MTTYKPDLRITLVPAPTRDCTGCMFYAQHRDLCHKPDHLDCKITSSPHIFKLIDHSKPST